MRVAEEIDAVESMAVHAVSYLVSTRLIAGLIAIVPLYALSVLAAFFAARFTTVYINGQSAGLYDHYFNTFLVPSDLLWSFLQAIVMSVAVMWCTPITASTPPAAPSVWASRWAKPCVPR